MRALLIQKNIFYVAFVFYVFVAYKSEGFHQADEHYQIIDFASYKLGKIDSKSLAWEYSLNIRSGFLPLICYLVFSVLSFLGLNDPFEQVFTLRLITALFSLVVIRKFISVTNKNLGTGLNIVYQCLSYFLWCLPYIYSRFSSETISGLFFFLGIAFILDKKSENKNHYFFFGALMGISLLCRFQMALMLVGFLIWQLFINKESLKFLMHQLYGIITILILGLFIDWWLYGNIQVTAYNYFYWNIIRDVASNFGTQPWYTYLWWLITKFPFPINLIVVASIFRLCITIPRHMAIWTIVPFLLVHSLIPHKEVRFMFPIIQFIPLIIVTAISGFYNNIEKNIYFKIGTGFAFCVNLIFLFLYSLKPAGDGRIKLAHYIKLNYYNPVVVMYTKDANPYNPFMAVTSKFYNNKLVTLYEAGSIWNLPSILKTKNPKTVLIVMKYSEIVGEESIRLLKANKLELKNVSLPQLQFLVYQITDGLLFDEPLLLFEYKDSTKYR